MNLLTALVYFVYALFPASCPYHHQPASPSPQAEPNPAYKSSHHPLDFLEIPTYDPAVPPVPLIGPLARAGDNAGGSNSADGPPHTTWQKACTTTTNSPTIFDLELFITTLHQGWGAGRIPAVIRQTKLLGNCTRVYEGLDDRFVQGDARATLCGTFGHGLHVGWIMYDVNAIIGNCAIGGENGRASGVMVYDHIKLYVHTGNTPDWEQEPWVGYSVNGDDS